MDQPAPAPDFTLPATSGLTVTLSALRGQPVVLYFYPKDNTPGCTNETRDFGEHYSAFAALGCAVFGISRDSVKVHENFRTKLGTPFDLISDADEVACTAYDVIRMKKMYGKEVRGIERSTFLIDADGDIVASWRKVKVAGHAEAVLARLRELAA